MRAEDFDLAAAIERHARGLCRDIRNPKKRKAVTAEFVEHMEDATYQYMLAGMSDAEAFAAAVSDLGDAEKVSTLLAVAHNGDGWPQWFRWMLGAVAMAALMTGHLLAERDAVRTASGFGLVILAACFLWRGLRRMRLFIRALIKRKSAKARIMRFAAENGMVFTRHKNPYLSLLFPGDTPEWVVDTADCRYIVSLFPTFEPHSKIHFHENGLYVTAKESGFLSRFAFGRMHTMKDAEITLGIYQMRPIDYERYHAPDKESIHILLLNSAPWDIDLCRNGHVRLLHPNERMPTPYGGARACSASDFIRLLGIRK